MLLHALFALALWYAMQPRLANPALAPVQSDQALLVRLIDLPSEPRAAPPPEPPAPPTPPQAANPRVRPATREKPQRDALAMQDHAAPPAPAASVATPPATGLFAKDGSVRLPPTQATYADPRAKAKPAEPPDDRRIMQHDSNRMQYKATRFEKYFPPPNETAGGAVGRHIGDALKKIAANMCDPKKPSTATNLLCGAPPLPPSPKDRDERLNLPPAPLAGDPHPAKPLPLATCFALYRADKPLPDGCPINTPDLAFQAEMRECIDLFRAGKRLKTWCPADTATRAAAEAARPAGASRAGSP